MQAPKFYDVQTKDPHVILRVETTTEGMTPDIGAGLLRNIVVGDDAGWNYANRLGEVLGVDIERGRSSNFPSAGPAGSIG
jgi:hypothetical protein